MSYTAKSLFLKLKWICPFMKSCLVKNEISIFIVCIALTHSFKTQIV